MKNYNKVKIKKSTLLKLVGGSVDLPPGQIVSKCRAYCGSGFWISATSEGSCHAIDYVGISYVLNGAQGNTWCPSP